MRRIFCIVAISSIFAVQGNWSVVCAQEAHIEVLVKQLKSPSTTDEAAAELRELASSDPQAKAYLTSQLPKIIANEEAGGPWTNAVNLAGDLRIAEAAPSLAKWIGVEAGGVTMTQFLRLETMPAGKALAQIGDPAIPSLVLVLQHGNTHERRNAYMTLNVIGSAGAREAIREALPKEQNTNLRNFIEEIISAHSSGRSRARPSGQQM